MKLTEMSQKRKMMAKRALRENYEINLNYDRLNLKKTKIMLTHVRGLLKESRSQGNYHQRHETPGYMKLVMMEQALSDHYNDLRVQYRIMLENEEVQKSQVILAAQDMIDSVQKMVEQISKMKVEELPAVVTGISNEIGTSESEQFNSSVGEALGALETSLGEAKTALTGALGAITGEGGGEFQPPGEEMPEPEMGGEESPAGDEMGGEEDMGGEPEALPPPPEEDEEPAGPAGRGLR